jgi:hypothetical protein
MYSRLAGNFRRLLARHAYYLSNFREFFILAFILSLPLPYPLWRFAPDRLVSPETIRQK